MNNYSGNITTVIKFIVMTFAPYIGLSEALSNQLIPIIVAIIGFILAYLDAYYPNTFSCLGNNQEDDTNDQTA